MIVYCTVVHEILTASDLPWGSCVMQVPAKEMESDLPVKKEMSHESLWFASLAFKWSELRCPEMDEEGFSVVSTFKCLDDLLWGEAFFCRNRRNLGVPSFIRGIRAHCR